VGVVGDERRGGRDELEEEVDLSLVFRAEGLDKCDEDRSSGLGSDRIKKSRAAVLTLVRVEMKRAKNVQRTAE